MLSQLGQAGRGEVKALEFRVCGKVSTEAECYFRCNGPLSGLGLGLGLQPTEPNLESW